MHALSALLVLIFGAATLLLHNKRSSSGSRRCSSGSTSLAFLGSFWIGKHTLTERFLGSAFGERLQLSAARGAPQRLVGGLLRLLGALNLAVAHYASERAWVAFKVFGLTALTLAFTLARCCGCMHAEPRRARSPRG